MPKYITVVHFVAFLCAFLALFLGLGLFNNPNFLFARLPYAKRLAKFFARLGACFASLAFIFDIFFYKFNPGGGLKFGFAFTTFAMIILLGYAIVPVLFITGTGEIKMPTLTLEEKEDKTYEAVRIHFERQKGNVDDEELRKHEMKTALEKVRHAYAQYRIDKKEGRTIGNGIPIFEFKNSQ